MTDASLPVAVELLVSLLMLAGGGFALVGAIGLVRLRDLYLRVHAPTKASTLGVGGALLASMVYFGWTGHRLVIHELLITVFVFLTAPISAHLIVKTALEREAGRRPPLPPPPRHADGVPISAETRAPADPDARR